jgi:hypothetical protein
MVLRAEPGLAESAVARRGVEPAVALADGPLETQKARWGHRAHPLKILQCPLLKLQRNARRWKEAPMQWDR